MEGTWSRDGGAESRCCRAKANLTAASCREFLLQANGGLAFESVQLRMGTSKLKRQLVLGRHIGTIGWPERASAVKPDLFAGSRHGHLSCEYKGLRLDPWHPY